MPVWRKRQIEWHGVEVPVFKQGHQFVACQVCLGHVIGQPEYTHASQAGCQVGVAIVNCQYVAASYLDDFAIA